MQITTLNNLLEELKAQSENDLFEYVVQDVIDNEFDTVEDVKTYLSDVTQYGCQTGIVSGLIYTADIREVFTKYGDDIFEIVSGGDITMAHFEDMDHFVTSLVWIAFEVEAGNLLGFVESVEIIESDGEEDESTKGGEN